MSLPACPLTWICLKFPQCYVSLTSSLLSQFPSQLSPVQLSLRFPTISLLLTRALTGRQRPYITPCLETTQVSHPLDPTTGKGQSLLTFPTHPPFPAGSLSGRISLKFPSESPEAALMNQTSSALPTVSYSDCSSSRPLLPSCLWGFEQARPKGCIPETLTKHLPRTKLFVTQDGGPQH